MKTVIHKYIHVLLAVFAPSLFARRLVARR